MATHLARGFRQYGHTIHQIYARNIVNATTLATTVDASAIDNLSALDHSSDVYIIAVPDTVIGELQLKLPHNALVVHTSGATPSEVLAQYSNNYGVLYPLYSFNKSASIDLQKVPFFITANTQDGLQTIDTIARSVTDKIFILQDDQRLSLHLAAVLTNNFIHHLSALTQHYIQRENLEWEYLAPIISQTMSNLSAQDLIATQTGPARRSDHNTIGAHLDLLKQNPALATLYKAISDSIIKLYS